MVEPLKVAPDGVVVKVALLHFNDKGQVLFARSRGQTLAYTLGGKPSHGEQFMEALVREVKEESGADLIADTIRFYKVFEDQCYGYVEGTKLLMYCFTGDYKGTPLPMAEIEELVYLDADDIGRGRTTPMGEKILNHLAEENLIGPFRE